MAAEQSNHVHIVTAVQRLQPLIPISPPLLCRDVLGWEVLDALRPSYGLRGQQDGRSGASIPGELDQRDGVDVADQHGHRHPAVVHPEHPVGEPGGRIQL